MYRLAVLLFVAFLSAAAVARAAQDDNVFSLGDGRFEIEGGAPRGFTEFRYLYVEGAQLRRGPGGRVTASPAGVKGELYGRRKFRLKAARFEGDRFTFETAAVGGVHFQFDGTVSPALPGPDQPLLPAFKGRLLKFVNGKKVGEARVTFGYLEPEF